MEGRTQSMPLPSRCVYGQDSSGSRMLSGIEYPYESFSSRVPYGDHQLRFGALAPRMPMSTMSFDFHEGVFGFEDDSDEVEANIAAASGGSTVGPSFFDSRIVEEMEVAEPGFRDWLESRSGILYQLLMFLVFWVLEIGKPFVYKLSTFGVPKDEYPLIGFMIIVKGFCSMSFCLLLSYIRAGQEGLSDCYPSRTTTLKLIPLSSLNTIANISSMKALNHIDAGTFKLMLQLSLIATAVLSFVLLRRRYTILQVESLMIVLLAACTFFLITKAERASYTISNDEVATWNIVWIGLFIVSTAASLTGLYTVGRTASFLFLQTLALMLVLSVMFYYTRRDISVSPDVPDGHKVGGEQHSFVVGTFFTIVCVTSSSLGSVVGERFLVRDQRGYNAQKLNLEIAGMPLAVISMLSDCPEGWLTDWAWIVKGPSLKGWFAGWTWKVWLYVAWWLVLGWYSGLMIKQFSAVVKRLMQCCSAVITYGISAAIGPITPSIPGSLSAFLIIEGVALFFSSPKLETKKREDPQTKPNPRGAMVTEMTGIPEEDKRKTFES